MLDIESLISSLGEGAPSGDDLEYDPVFAALEQAGAGKPEQQYGDTIVAAQEPDWRTVHEHAMALTSRTRDLRVAIWLVRSKARLHGLADAASALQLVHGLLLQHWDTVHPQLDASDGNDPTMRMNALAPLASGEAALADLRAATLSPERGSLTLRGLELGLGKAEPITGESAPSEAGALEALGTALTQQPALAEAVAAALQAVRDSAKLLDERVGSLGPELTPLIRLLKTADDAIRRTTGQDAAGAAAEDGQPASDPGSAPRGAVATPGAIVTRDDAVRALGRVCEWIERHEPSHPAPLLIRRAQRLMSMSFLEIMRDMAPDGMSQIQVLAGPEPDNG
ncbi:type VI secretion system protein TssA [Aquabacterium sp.]|uniref:type VI secretion system protein TssA n=1 Tax=Aquabacterium sp. TaxID=1872578 RepID=UPI002C803432|nr:type VI secretion system protein TssA [Aquabacterium sp.]HSW08710.1 type VI secretion system protein TssA [Aquabacterium sp.]